jgi:hypothetical protein
VPFIRLSSSLTGLVRRPGYCFNFSRLVQQGDTSDECYWARKAGIARSRRLNLGGVLAIFNTKARVPAHWVASRTRGGAVTLLQPSLTR